MGLKMAPYIPAEVLFRYMPVETDTIPPCMLVCKAWKKELDRIKETVIFDEFYNKYSYLKNETYLANPNCFDLHRHSFLTFLDRFKKHIDNENMNEDIFEDILKDRILPNEPSDDQTKAYHTVTILISLYEYSFEKTITKPYKYYSSWICYLLHAYIIRLFDYGVNPICLNVNFVNSCRTNIQNLLSQQNGFCMSLKTKMPRLLRHGMRVVKID